ncbi:MAG: BON domain-containing protein, partial [Verrucomicrobiota bacterium]
MAGKEPPNKTAPRGGGIKDFFVGLLTGVFLCGLIGGYYVIRKKPAVRHAQDTTAAAIHNAVATLDTKLEAWHLTSTDIERELTQTGKVVRRQMTDFGVAIADAASDSALTGKIKAKLALDKDLNGFSIGVTTTDGRVT